MSRLANSQKLTGIRVMRIYEVCLFRKGEDISSAIIAEGLTFIVGFHPERLEQHRADIHEMLSELPDDCRTSGGGGMSFMKAYTNRHEGVWTALRLRAEQLILLGIAIDEVAFCAPREFWHRYPYGMPYFMVKQ